MKVVIDNNIVIDALKPNPDFEADAKRVFQLMWKDRITPYMCANSLTDIFYIMQKVQGAKKAKHTISNLMTAIKILPLTESLSFPIFHHPGMDSWRVGSGLRKKERMPT